MTLLQTGFHYHLAPLGDGKYSLTLRNQSLNDLSFIKDAPIEELDISQTSVSDLSALRSPGLSGSLRRLVLWQIPATDSSPLAACTNVDFFDAADTALSDLEVLRGCKLHTALLISTRIKDISVLAGMPLERVTLANTAVTNQAPLLHCPTLTELVLPRGARDIGALHALPSLTRLSFEKMRGGFSQLLAGDFWLHYDAGTVATNINKRSAWRNFGPAMTRRR